MTTSKVYITKQKLEELIAQMLKEQDQYPKPIFTILVALLTIIIMAVAAVILLLIVVTALMYLLVGWVDIIIGKYIIKRIFK